MRKKIAQILKTSRRNNGYTTEYVSSELKKLGLDISGNTLYNYENMHSQPSADMFIALCKIYGINDLSVFYDFTDDDKKIHPIVKLFNTLNSLGKQKVVEYISDIKGDMNYSMEFQKYIEQTDIEDE